MGYGIVILHGPNEEEMAEKEQAYRERKEAQTFPLTTHNGQMFVLGGVQLHKEISGRYKIFGEVVDGKKKGARGFGYYTPATTRRHRGQTNVFYFIRTKRPGKAQEAV